MYGDILKRYNIAPPPVLSGVADGMYSLDGRWVKEGQTVGNYTVGKFNPKTNQLGMSVYGMPMNVGMNQGTVSSYFTEQFANDPTLEMPFTHSTDFGEEQFRGFDDQKMLEQMRLNIKNNKNIDYEHNGLLSYEQYHKLIESGKAQKGIYLIPKRTEDGEVDLQNFNFNGYEPEPPQ